VRADEIIVLEKQAISETAPFLRRVRYWDEPNQRELVFLTNHLDLPATTVAAVYKERWQIELLFKALKQQGQQTTIGDGHAMGVAAQVLDDVLRAAERSLGIDYPAGFFRGCQISGAGLRITQIFQIAEELELPGGIGLLQGFQK
jgi:hypothetical protein